MKAHLLYSNLDFDLETSLPWNEEALRQDLALDILWNAMAQEDKFVLDVVSKVTLLSITSDSDTILRRQNILGDCLNQPAVVRELYAVSVEATDRIKKHYLGALSRSPDWVLRLSIELIEALLDIMKKLRKIADSHVENFISDGWIDFFAMLKRELSDEFFTQASYHLNQLKFRKGVLLSAVLDKGNKGRHYVLRRPSEEQPGWLEQLLTRKPSAFGFSIHPRDEGGARALSDLQDRGVSLVATALAQSADHVGSFFRMLRTELAFYVGCVNLHEQLLKIKAPICFPLPVNAEEPGLAFTGLYDVCLALNLDRRVTGNDVNAEGQELIVVTGANQGGKSTFLRSVGLAQLMMQCGMFTPAEAFRSRPCDGLMTHYKREEDATMKSGKLDEELFRMSEIVDHLTPRSMVLCNESFAATNEREGSEIATQIVSALLEKSVRMICVTHLYEFARGFHERKSPDVLFLRAERQADGARTFRLIEGIPLETSFGDDLYRRVFGAETAPLRAELQPA